jgi:hypothetical protein
VRLIVVLIEICGYTNVGVGEGMWGQDRGLSPLLEFMKKKSKLRKYGNIPNINAKN